MRKQIILVLLLMISTTVTFAAITPAMQITTEQTNMQPGGTGYLTLTLSNTGSGTAYATKVTLNGLSNPLTSDNLCTSCILYDTNQNTCLTYSDSCYYNIGDIGVNNAKTYIIPIKIPENITSGYYTANLQIKYQTDASGTTSYTDYIEIIRINNSANDNLVITNVGLPAGTINPGEEFNLTLSIANMGSSDANNVRVTLDTNNFNTIGTSNMLIIGNILSGETKTVTFSLLSDNSLTAGVYPVDSVISYTSNGQVLASQGSFGIKLGGQDTNFAVYISNVRQTTSGISFDAQFANIGLITAKSVGVTLQYLGMPVNSNYIGDLTSGSYSKTSFTITTVNAANTTNGFNRTRSANGQQGMNASGFFRNQTNMSFTGTQPLMFVISYTNLLGQRVTTNVPAELNLNQITGSSTSTTAFRQTTTSTTIDMTSVISWVFIGGVIILVVYFFIKSRRKEK
ncbi:Uncharacterised protein [Candidatus Tiddalikarchaeum anstoanum]|nr:Uncharacterised protein [Candidatus Tiddalikarchaeum anstoanum]